MKIIFCSLKNKEVELVISQKLKSTIGNTTLRKCSYKYCDKTADEECLCNKFMGRENI